MFQLLCNEKLNLIFSYFLVKRWKKRDKCRNNEALIKTRDNNHSILVRSRRYKKWDLLTIIISYNFTLFKFSLYFFIVSRTIYLLDISFAISRLSIRKLAFNSQLTFIRKIFRIRFTLRFFKSHNKFFESLMS